MKRPARRAAQERVERAMPIGKIRRANFIAGEHAAILRASDQRAFCASKIQTEIKRACIVHEVFLRRMGSAFCGRIAPKKLSAFIMTDGAGECNRK